MSREIDFGPRCVPGPRGCPKMRKVGSLGSDRELSRDASSRDNGWYCLLFDCKVWVGELCVGAMEPWVYMVPPESFH